MPSLEEQIKYVEDNIAIKKRMGKDTTFEKELVKEWRRYLHGGDKRRLWLAYSREGSHERQAQAL